MFVRIQKDGGCLRCNRKLKIPHPSGMGPVCRKKHAAEMAKATPVAEGQEPLFPHEGVA